MIGRILRNILALALMLGVTVGGVLTAAVFYHRIELNRIESRYGLPQVGTDSVPFLGFTADGSRVELSSGDRGLAVWYAARDCPYCKLDTEWTKLADSLKGSGLRVVVLVSKSAQQFEPDQLRPKGATQVLFVGPEWLARFPLNVTPTLLIFDRHGRLVWHKHGILTTQDSTAVMRTVQATLR